MLSETQLTKSGRSENQNIIKVLAEEHPLFDKSDNGNDGIIHGAVSTTGNIGEALDFNGTGDYVSLSSSS
ncbi:MAG: hypothetical protein U9Q89_00690, partial [Thermodesulfobacteriota bacterium]|nr:hypothetical protein [Thermodesulfobacteriota bacterium]